ncbi:MAG: MFS transporter [Betaproteobacteria bacterium]|nr:MFS transporter [Betaproteobacteria bacterium]
MKLFDKLFDVRREEVPALAWAFCYFFFLLCAYYVLRPVRDEMGIQGGTRNLPWLFTGTFVGMLVVTPLFGWLTTRWPRRTFLPVVYLFFIANIVFFYFAMLSESLDKKWVAAGFFIWLSVINYFVVSVFWSFMTDIFDSAAAKRLFGAIAAGGSIGAMTGPLITAALVKTIGIPNLLLISAVLMGGAVVCVVGLGRWARASTGDVEADEKALGGSVLDGIRLAARSPYLLSLCGYIFLLQALGTFFYLEQVRIMAETIPSSAERTQLFAQLDLAVNTITLVTQLFATGVMLKGLGIVFCLSILPVLCVFTLGVTAVLPTLAVISVATVIRRACEFAVGKPAREILFTVVTREERYKSKNFIDTVVSRGADVVSTWSHAGLRTLGFGASQIAIVCIPLSIGMIAAGLFLGREQEKRARMPARA